MLDSMCRAAEKRVAGLTENQRRRHHTHAALLIAICAELDSIPDALRWLAALRAEYRRHPALRRELDARLGRR